MKRLIAALVLLSLGLLTTMPAMAQWGTIYTDAVRPSSASGGGAATTPVQLGPSSTSGCQVLSTGELSCTQAHTDGYIFLPAVSNVVCTDAGGANFFRASRVGSNDWMLTHPNGLFGGATTINCSLDLNNWLQRAGSVKGTKITSLDLVYQITGAALTSHNLACNPATVTPACLGGITTTTYANNAADVVGGPLQTQTTLATATQTNPYLTNVPVASPVFQPANVKIQYSFEWQAVGQAAGSYRVYGVGVNYQVLAE